MAKAKTKTKKENVFYQDTKYSDVKPGDLVSFIYMARVLGVADPTIYEYHKRKLIAGVRGASRRNKESKAKGFSTMLTPMLSKADCLKLLRSAEAGETKIEWMKKRTDALVEKAFKKYKKNKQSWQKTYKRNSEEEKSPKPKQDDQANNDFDKEKIIENFLKAAKSVRKSPENFFKEMKKQGKVARAISKFELN